MSWILAGDILFRAGQLLSAALIFYGAWLCLAAWANAWQPSASKDSAAQTGRDPAVLRSITDLDWRPKARGIWTSLWTGLFVFGLVAALATPSALADVPLERGVQAFEQSRYGDAIAEFRSAANAGDSRAQEILGFMYLHGPNLYGASVPLDRDQAIHWFRHAALGGSEVAKHMLCVLTGRPANTVIHRAGCVKAVSRTSSD